MAEAVPDAINNYFQAVEQGDLPRLMDCFAEDATVTDEDKSYQGRSETVIGVRRSPLSTRTR